VVGGEHGDTLDLVVTRKPKALRAELQRSTTKPDPTTQRDHRHATQRALNLDLLDTRLQRLHQAGNAVHLDRSAHSQPPPPATVPLGRRSRHRLAQLR
jgi:hypothetical protein